MSMKYGFINRFPGSVHTKTKQLGNLVKSAKKTKKQKKHGQMGCLVLGRPDKNLPVIFVTYTDHRTDRDCHDFHSSFP